MDLVRGGRDPVRAGWNVPAECAKATAGARGRRQTSAGALDRLPRYAGTATADADGEGRPSTGRPRRNVRGMPTPRAFRSVDGGPDPRAIAPPGRHTPA